MEEIWKNINGYEGYYQISNYGNVKSMERIIYDKNGKLTHRLKEKIMKPYEVNGGYLQICLNKNGKRKPFKVHRLVAEHFLDNTYDKKEVNHKDRNVKNNNVNNLEWVTPKENMKHLEDNFDFDFGRKKVNVYDKDFNFIKKFPSIHEASIFAGAKLYKNNKPFTGNVYRSLKSNGQLLAYGYRFLYSD